MTLTSHMKSLYTGVLKGGIIQNQLKSTEKTMLTSEIWKRFIEKMLKCNINRAIKLLTDNIQTRFFYSTIKH